MRTAVCFDFPGSPLGWSLAPRISDKKRPVEYATATEAAEARAHIQTEAIRPQMLFCKGLFLSTCLDGVSVKDFQCRALMPVLLGKTLEKRNTSEKKEFRRRVSPIEGRRRKA